LVDLLGRKPLKTESGEPPAQIPICERVRTLSLAEMSPEQSYKPPMLPLFALACGAAVAADLMNDQPVRRIIA
jgi:hypothetical protein